MSATLNLQRPEDFQVANPVLFPSMESWRWFVRQNKAELVSAGAVVCPAGRWLVQPEAFSRTVLTIGQRRAQRK